MNYLDFMKPEEITISKMWAVICAHLFKDRAVPSIQYEEMRRAFYMGFTEGFKVMVDVSERLSETDAAAVMTRLNDEAAAFHVSEIEKLKKGEQR